MKKGLLTFCAFVLLSTQATAANAAVNNSEEVSGNSYEKLFKSIQTFKYKTTILNKEFKDWNSISDIIKFTKANSVEEKATKSNKPVTKVEKAPESTNKKPVTEVEKTQEVTKEQPKAPAKEVTPEQPKAPAKEVTPEQPKATETTTQSNNAQATKQPSAPVTSNSSSVDAIEAAVVELTNVERTKAGLQPLKTDAPLMASARTKSQDMKDKNYFSHTSPTYGSPFDQMKSLGISYKSAGENIAKGQRTAEEVVTAWMNSEGHRANILNPDYTHIGVGYVKDGNIWTQQFIKK